MKWAVYLLLVRYRRDFESPGLVYWYLRDYGLGRGPNHAGLVPPGPTVYRQIQKTWLHEILGLP